MGRIICPLCEHYDTCKYWESLREELNDRLGGAVDFIDEKAFDKWRERFARFCMYFRLDEPNLELLIKCGLDFIFHDYVWKLSDKSESK